MVLLFDLTQDLWHFPIWKLTFQELYCFPFLSNVVWDDCAVLAWPPTQILEAKPEKECQYYSEFSLDFNFLSTIYPIYFAVKMQDNNLSLEYN